MIELIEGRLGGGKTYYAVKRSIKYIASGGIIATNIEINRKEYTELVRRRFNYILDSKQIIELSWEQVPLFHRFLPAGDFSRPNLAILDEAQLFMNSRAWKNFAMESVEFLTQSRKQFTDIIFITQHSKNIDCIIQRLIQYRWICRDMQKLSLLGCPYPLPHFYFTQHDYLDNKIVLSRNFEWKDKEIYRIYNTFQICRNFPRLEKFEHKGRKEKKSMKFFIIIFLLLFFLVYSFWSWAKNGFGLKRSGKKIKSSIESIQKTAGSGENMYYPITITSVIEFNGKKIYYDQNNGPWFLGAIKNEGYVESIRDNIICLRTKDGIKKFIDNSYSMDYDINKSKTEGSLKNEKSSYRSNSIMSSITNERRKNTK